MNQANSRLHFYFHLSFFKIRDLFSPPANVLKEVQIKSGFRVLDYGCGPGSYVIPLAGMVGKTGRVCAVDINPLAIERVKGVILRKKLGNVSAVCSDCETGLSDNNIDAVLLYDVFHALNTPVRILNELHRILKSNGILSIQDHRMTKDEIVHELTKSGYFKLLKKNRITCTFQKI